MENAIMEIAEIIEKAGFGVAAAAGLAFLVRWILTRVVTSMDGLLAAQVEHEVRSTKEHGRIIGALDDLNAKINGG